MYVSCGTTIVIGAHHTKSLDLRFFFLCWTIFKNVKSITANILFMSRGTIVVIVVPSLILESCEAMKCIMLLVVYVFGLVSVQQNHIGRLNEC